METKDPTFELKAGKLFVNGDPVPLRKGIVYAALARAGWDGHEGPVSRDFTQKLLDADRRISIYGLARELNSPAA